MSIAIATGGSNEAQFNHVQCKEQGLRFYSKLVVLAVLGLIFKGALVTSHDAGLAVPDWPMTFGENMFTFAYSKWVGGIFFEHGHRLYASIVGALIVILAFWIWLSEKRTAVRYMGLSALALVMIQGMLGGLTVRLQLPDEVSIAHGVLGQTFFVLTIAIAYAYSAELHSEGRNALLAGQDWLKRSAVGLLVLIYLQLIIGATVRHTFSGLAIPDFPTMGGQWLPPFGVEALARINAMRFQINLAPIAEWNVIAHFIHRLMAFGIVFFVGSIFYVVWRSQSGIVPHIRKNVIYVGLAIALQFALGIATIWTHRGPFTTSFHVLVGAVTLGLTALLVMRLIPLQRH